MKYSYAFYWLKCSGLHSFGLLYTAISCFNNVLAKYIWACYISDKLLVILLIKISVTKQNFFSMVNNVLFLSITYSYLSVIILAARYFLYGLFVCCLYLGCASMFPNYASDYGLVVANGTYTVTAGHCVQCSCSAGDPK